MNQHAANCSGQDQRPSPDPDLTFERNTLFAPAKVETSPRPRLQPSVENRHLLDPGCGQLLRRLPGPIAGFANQMHRPALRLLFYVGRIQPMQRMKLRARNMGLLKLHRRPDINQIGLFRCREIMGWNGS